MGAGDGPTRRDRRLGTCLHIDDGVRLRPSAEGNQYRVQQHNQTCSYFEFRSKEFTAHLSIETLRAKNPHVWERLDNLHGAISVALYDLHDQQLSQSLTAELGFVYALELDYHSVGGVRRMQTDLSQLRRVQLEVNNSCEAATTQVTT
jgi:hypothetical protein